MRQIESGLVSESLIGTQAPIEETEDVDVTDNAGNDTSALVMSEITSCSDVESDMPSHAGPSTNSEQAKDALAQQRQPESSAVRAQSNSGQ